MIHISDVKRYKRCQRLYYLDQDQATVYQPYLRHDEELTKLVVDYLGIDGYYIGQRGDAPERVIKELNDHEWFVKARFAYDDLRIKVPLLHKVRDGYELYFVMYAPFPKDEDVEFYRDNLWVLRENGIKITKVYIVHLNGEYVRDKDLDLKKLFVVSDHLYHQGRPSIKLDDLIDDGYDLSDILARMKKGSLAQHPPIKRRRCKLRGLCDFYAQCFPQVLPDNSIEFLVSSAKKDQMINEGIKYLKDARIDLIEGTRVQYAQIQADRNGGSYHDDLALSKWLASFKDKTLVFIDFEWETYMIPPYRGLRPYEHVPFQYSMHMLKKDGTLTHREFIQTGDCREDFIRSLLKDVPKDAYLIAYNAKGAEMLRLSELKRQFEAYAPFIDELLSRFIDMAYPFQEGLVYDTKMRGNFSVKSLVKVVSDMDYEELAISSGMDAVYKWRLLDLNDKYVDLDDVKKDLSAYCSLDSYSLYLIYKWLLDLMAT